MLNKLRLRFILLSMSLIALIVLIIFIAVYVMMYTLINQRYDDILDLAEDTVIAGMYFKRKENSYTTGAQDQVETPMTQNSKANSGENKDLERNDDPFDDEILSTNGRYRQWLFKQVITMIYDKDGCIISIDVPLDQEDMNAFLGKSVDDLTESEGAGLLFINNVPYKYRKVSYMGYGIVLLMNNTGAVDELDSLLSVLTTVGACAFLIIFLICLMTSKRIIEPTAKAWEQQKNFVADASHELKTPLTVIAANMDVIKSNPKESVESQSKWFGYIDAEISDMQKLISDMLDLAKLDVKESGKVVYSRINLSDIVTESGLISESRTVETGVEIDLRVTDDIYINGDEKKIKQVVMILLDNAIKHTPSGGKIILSLTRIKNEAVLVCYNTGEGIPEGELKLIFERFYRADESRARITGGSGLGLAIAKGIVEAHGGKIYAESELKSFTRFTIKLSVADKKR